VVSHSEFVTLPACGHQNIEATKAPMNRTLCKDCVPLENHMRHSGKPGKLAIMGGRRVHFNGAQPSPTTHAIKTLFKAAAGTLGSEPDTKG
jgi:hypothetical protein